MSKPNLRSITVNQIGYSTEGAKIAIVNGEGQGFRVIHEETGEVVYAGKSGAAVLDKPSGAKARAADFSEVRTAGRYYVEGDDGSISASFVIADKPYQELQQGLLKAFYYFRCGVELTGEYAGPWAHGACHTAEGIVHGQPEKRLDGCGGWHDAGDYGKALINQGETRFLPTAFPHHNPFSNSSNFSEASVFNFLVTCM